MASSSAHSKPCTLCNTPRDVLVRCQIDQTGRWHFVCPGSCWKNVSGGVIDGDKAEQHQDYRYGGMWKNKHEAVSAKKPKPSKRSAKDGSPAQTQHHHWNGQEISYTKNDRVLFEGETFVCRKSHVSQERKTPAQNYASWKHDGPSVAIVES